MKIEELPSETSRKAQGRPEGTPTRTRIRPLLTFFAILLVAIAGIIVAGILPRLRREKTLDSRVEAVEREEARPLVNVAVVKTAPTSGALELPGDMQAVVESPIFARSDGYLKKRYADIGDKVKAGQVLAEIETPELDLQIDQARATLANAKSSLAELRANEELAKAHLALTEKTLDRWRQLEAKGTVSHQEADEKGADRDVRKAEVDAAAAKLVSEADVIHADEANLHRLEQLKAFSKVTAPFSGVVTARNVDIGTLINAGNGGAAKELFRMAETGTMRIFVNVPQASVSVVHPGMKADVRVQELPGQTFLATVERVAESVDPNSRSMQSILTIPNPHGVLLPGMYAQVTFTTSRSGGALLIPGDALIVNAKGTQVATVDQANKVHLKAVRVGNDLGSVVEVLSGVAAGDRVVMNPTDVVREGATVEVHQTS